MSIDKQLIKSDLSGDSYYKIKHKSGLTVLVWEMNGFSSTYALFGTKYGSINTKFKTKNEDDFIEVPEGIAHFLEHKLFENEDCDVFELYAKTGASGNAYTSFDQTCYLFSCSEKYDESLKILLDFVQKPYFTQETVDKEQGIIGQEIKMCNDQPARKVYFNLLSSLYKNHPVKIDIAGTVESIAQIDADLLYRCYNSFYNLNNMVLSIAGNVDVEKVLEVCDECLIEKEDVKLETAFPEEPYEIENTESVEKMEVGVPIFALGYKFPAFEKEELIKKDLECSILVNLICGATSNLYKKMYDESLINSSFAAEVDNGDGFFLVAFSGESNKPKEVANMIYKKIDEMISDGINSTEFEIVKKAQYGKMIRGLNNVENCATLMLESELLVGIDAFSRLNALSSITEEDLMKTLKDYFIKDKSAISIVMPK